MDAAVPPPRSSLAPAAPATLRIHSVSLAVAFSALLAVIVLTPLPFGSARPWLWHLPTVLAALALLCALPAWREAARNMPWGPALLAAGVLIWGFLQTRSWMPAEWHHPAWQTTAAFLNIPAQGMIAIAEGPPYDTLARMLGYICVFLLAFALGGERGRAALTIRVAIWSAAIYAAYGLAMQFSGLRMVLWFDKWSYFDDVTGPFVNRNNFATYLGFALVAALAVFLDMLRDSIEGHRARQERLRRIMERAFGAALPYLAAIAVLLTAAILTHSRAGFVSVMLGLFTMVALWTVKETASRTLPLAVLFFAVLAVMGLLALGGDSMLDRILTLSSDTEERDNVYILTLGAVEARPWLGYGLGTFEETFAAFRDVTVQHTWNKAHSTYLELVMDLGFAGAAAWVLAQVWIALACLRGYFIRKRDRLYPLVAFGCAVIGGAHSLFDFSLQIPGVTVLFAALLGIGYRQSFSTRAP